VKKMFLGALLLICGIIGMLVFIVLSIVHPWDYNNITGLLGFLLGSETIWEFILFFIMFTTCIAICFYEAYIRKSI
jgi:hypothetical protein